MKIYWVLLLICAVACTSNSSELEFLNGVSSVSSDDICSLTVRQAYFRTERQCADTSRNQICYGNTMIDAERTINTSPNRFEFPGDIVDLADVNSLRLSGMDTRLAQWGIARLNVQAALPDTFPQDVEIILFGDVNLSETNQAEYAPMQAFLFSSGADDAPCASAPESGMLIQTPSSAGQINFLINEVDIRVGSTLFIQADENFMTVYTLDGLASATAFNSAQPIPKGALVRIPLENGVASGAPLPPEIMDYESLQNFPLDIFTELVVVPTLTPSAAVLSPELETALQNIQTGRFLLVGLEKDEVNDEGQPIPFDFVIDEPDASGQITVSLFDNDEVIYLATMMHSNNNNWRSDDGNLILSFDERDKQNVTNDICLGNPIFSGVFLTGFSGNIEGYIADTRTTCIGNIEELDLQATIVALSATPTPNPELELARGRVQTGWFSLVGLNSDISNSAYEIIIGALNVTNEFSVSISDFYQTTMRYSSGDTWVSEDGLLTLNFRGDTKDNVRNDICVGNPMFTGHFSGDNSEFGGLRIEMYRRVNRLACFGQTSVDTAQNGTYSGVYVTGSYPAPYPDCGYSGTPEVELLYTNGGLNVDGLASTSDELFIEPRQGHGIYGAAGTGGGSSNDQFSTQYMTLTSTTVLEVFSRTSEERGNCSSRTLYTWQSG